MPKIPEPVRSFVLTFLTVFIPLVLAPDFAWGWAALGAAAAAAARTAASALLPGGSFGKTPAGSGETGDE